MIVGFYLANLIISVFLLIAMLYLTKGRDCRFYIVLSFCVVLTNYADYSLVISKDLSAAYSAAKLDYINGTFCTLFLLLCIMQISNIKIRAWMSTILITLSLIVFGMAQTIGFSDAFYVAEFVHENGTSYLIKDYGPLHNCYLVLVALYAILSLCMIIYAYFHQNKASYKHTTMLALIELICIFTYIFERKAKLHYELVPFVNTLFFGCILWIIQRIAKYDISLNGFMKKFHANSYGYILFDLNKAYIGCNELAISIFPQLKNLYIDRKISDLEFAEFISKWIDEYHNNSEYEKNFEKDDRNYSCSINIYTTANSKKPIGYIIEIFDVTEKLKHIKELEAMNVALAEEAQKANLANQAKSSFLANMSHEIRTPINAVLGMDTMILRKSKDTEIRKYANDIQSAGKSLLSIINDILDFSKIEAGKMEIVPVDYDFSSLVNDVFNMINTKAEDKGLLFETDIDSNLPCRFFGDDVRIRQILVNLLTNAVKYTPSGKVTLKIYAIKGLSEDKENCSMRFEVKDTGIGIKPEDISKLTEEFVRIEESRNRNIEGTGLGINIVVSLLGLMGSKLEVDSVYGEGSVFAFTLDQPVTNSEAVGDITERIKNICNSEEEYQVSFSIPDARMLVVDDNSMNLTVFSSLLSDMLCQIDEADSGNRCLELVKENKYDIIFLDHMMPGMDGIETFHHMKEIGEYINSDTPVIILTANAISGAKEAYLAEGFNDYLSKPIELRSLEKLIKQYLPSDYIKPAVVSEKKDISEITFSKETLDATEGIIDFKIGYSYSANKKASYDTIIKSYIKKGKERLEYIRKLFEEKDWNNYVIEVHALKSSSLTIGAANLSELAKELELSGKSDDIDNIVDKNDLLLTLYKDAIDAASVYVKNEIEEDDATDIVNMSKEELLELFNQIVDAVDAFDSDAVLKLIIDKKNSEYEGENIGEFFSNIEDAVRDFNYEFVIEMIDEFKSNRSLCV